MSLALPITLTFNKRQVGDVLKKIMQVDTLRRGVTIMLRVPSGSIVTVSFPNDRRVKEGREQTYRLVARPGHRLWTRYPCSCAPRRSEPWLP